jgi:4-methylaminobutanoate oxidase (formaldehyde-forming)
VRASRITDAGRARLERSVPVEQAAGVSDALCEAGLGVAVRFDKLAPLRGREALLRRKDERFTRRLVHFVLDDPDAVPWGDEPIWCGGGVVGWISSVAFGHPLDRAAGRGRVRRPEGVAGAFLAGADFGIEIAGERFAARGSLEAPEDPDGLRVKR